MDDMLVGYKRAALEYRHVVEDAFYENLMSIYRAQAKDSKNVGKQKTFEMFERIYAR
jgi:hypothetical protein